MAIGDHRNIKYAFAKVISHEGKPTFTNAMKYHAPLVITQIVSIMGIILGVR